VKMLAEWFWTDRWMGSSASLLPMEPRGLYREMLTQAWRRGARLPNDHEAIRRAVGCTTREWSRSWPKIERYWRVDGESLVNDTQLEVYAKTITLRETRSKVGSKGGSKTAARCEQDPVAKINPPSPSPVSVSGNPSLEVGREVIAPPRYEPTRLPADKAENEVTAEIQRLQNVLGGWLCKLSEHPRSDLMVPAWTKRVTGYKRRDGVSVAGVSDYRTVRSIERLEKSIADAEWWAAKLDAPEAQRGA